MFVKSKVEFEKEMKEVNDILKAKSNEFETEMALSHQKNDFLMQEMEDLREKYNKSINYY